MTMNGFSRHTLTKPRHKKMAIALKQMTAINTSVRMVLPFPIAANDGNEFLFDCKLYYIKNVGPKLLISLPKSQIPNPKFTCVSILKEK